MRTPTNDTYAWIITEVVTETHDTKTLVLRAHGERPEFIAGQYLTVRLPHSEPSEGKSYSISSIPTEETVSLTIKEMGSFSRALLAHTPGETLVTSAPYGFFYPEPEEQRDLVFAAGGIGITPLVSIIESLLLSGYKNLLTLFYSNKTEDNIVFQERLTTLENEFNNFTATYFITRSPDVAQGHHARRMTPYDIVTVLREPHATDIFLCGSIDFTKTLWKGLRESNVPASLIYTEAFF